MKFVRVVVGRSSGAVLGVMDSDLPWVPGESVRPMGEDFEIADLGFVDGGVWTDTQGRGHRLAKHVFERLQRAGVKGRDVKERRASATLHVEGLHALADVLELPAIHECPCTLAGIKDRLRARGLAGIPVKARAWLALMLPLHEVALMGIGRGLPISAFKAAESARVARDPNGGSRQAVFERIAQRQAEARAKSRQRERDRQLERDRRRLERKAERAAKRAQETLARQVWADEAPRSAGPRTSRLERQKGA